MKKYSLPNGLTVIEEKRDSASVTVQVTVKVGSNSERKGIRGISHFIEHMLFEGTKKRKDAKEISSEIEKLGGDLNAFTDNVRTSYYAKVPKKYAERAFEILADALKNSIFRQENIEKERDVILKEINIFNDESRFFQWILFQGLLFRNHPSKYPAYGTVEDVKKTTRKDILDYYNHFYSASNSILCVVGDIDARRFVEKHFGDWKKGHAVKSEKHASEKNVQGMTSKKRKVLNSYAVLGYKTPSRIHQDSYVLDVIKAILGRGQSGLIFDEIRNKRGLAYEVGVHHETSTDFGFFAVYLSCHKKNIPLAKKLILEEFSKLSKISDKEISEAKGFVEGKFLLDNEDTHTQADSLSFWELIEKAELEESYLSEIRKVNKKDIARVAKDYLNNNYTFAMIEGK